MLDVEEASSKELAQDEAAVYHYHRRQHYYQVSNQALHVIVDME